ncbi:unnamed protein product [Protopolystoma xenopodis]|uniref:Uncharacterized protein n=1 Tax=Protopolystoma xenopodis TaxID=117903 RepID=A0A448X497_9PLAT|nr:unnamed protein product [Protopolystoma xenopodis]
MWLFGLLALLFAPLKNLSFYSIPQAFKSHIGSRGTWTVVGTTREGPNERTWRGQRDMCTDEPVLISPYLTPALKRRFCPNEGVCCFVKMRTITKACVSSADLRKDWVERVEGEGRPLAHEVNPVFVQLDFLI